MGASFAFVSPPRLTLPPTDSSWGFTVIMHVGWQLQVCPHTSSIFLHVRNRPVVFGKPTKALFIRRRSDNDVTLSERMKWGQNEANRLCKKRAEWRQWWEGLGPQGGCGLGDSVLDAFSGEAATAERQKAYFYFFCNSQVL